jgi:hypothetical protein
MSGEVVLSGMHCLQGVIFDDLGSVLDFMRDLLKSVSNLVEA